MFIHPTLIPSTLTQGKPPHKWYRQWLGYTEAAYAIFVYECAKAGPSKCPLAETQGKEPSIIRHRIEAFFDGLHLAPIAVPQGSRPSVLTSGLARKYFFVILEMPNKWKTASKPWGTR